MSIRVVRPCTQIEELRVRLLEARLATLAAQQETLRAAEQLLREQFRLTFDQVWRPNPDGPGYQIVTALPEGLSDLANQGAGNRECEPEAPEAGDDEVTRGD